MTQKLLYPSWKEFVVFSAGNPKPQILMEAENLKVVLVGLEAGNKIPMHSGPASTHHFLEGTGYMIVNNERLPVKAGATVVVPDGATRGVEADTRLAFLGVQARRS
jgi:quercetin dioxygenase-like cupin family protein